MKYVPSDTYIILNKNFKSGLFQKIKSEKNKGVVCNHLNISRQTFEGWERGEWSSRLIYILEIGKILNIPKEDIINAIKGLKSKYNRGLISLSSIKFPLNPEFAEWLGLIDGDGCINKKYVEYGSICFDLSFFIIHGLQKWFGINKNQICMEIRVPVNSDIKEAEHLERKIKSYGFSRITVRKIPNGINLLLISRASIKILATILNSLFEELNFLLKNSPNEIKAAYLKGFFAAEGSISIYRKSRTLEVSQKYYNKVLFIKELLSDLGIKVKGPRPTKYGFKIYLNRRMGIERFSRKIGFGHHKMKNKKLQEICKSYSLSEFRNRSRRYDEILNFIELQGSVNKSIIAQNQSVSKKYAVQLLREMMNNNIITADKSACPYLYFLCDKND